MIRRLALAGLLALAPLPAWAQAYPTGNFSVGHLLIAQDPSGSPYADAGGAAGSSLFGFGYATELGITNTGTPLCINDALTSGPYHQLCLGANSFGGGMLSFNAYNGAAATGFNILLNGQTYSFPGPGNGNVIGPVTTTVGEPAVWNSTGGTALADGLNFNIAHTGDLSIAAAVANFSSLNGLYFPTFTQTTSFANTLTLSGSIPDLVGSFTDGLYGQVTDSDTSVYTQSHTNYGARLAVFGPNPTGTPGGYVRSYKNHVALNPYSYCATVGTPLASGFAPGCSGINTNAVQFAEGIASNEGYGGNPAAASGGIGHSISIAGWQGIVDSSYADADSTHTAYAFLATNVGSHLATAAYGALNASGHNYLAFLDAGTSKVTQQGIIMPASLTNYVGTIINYGQNNGNPAGGSFTKWDGGVQGGSYLWYDSGVQIGGLGAQGMAVFPQASYDAFYAQPVSGTGAIAFAAANTWNNGLNLNGATINDAAIVLSNSEHGSTIRGASGFLQLGQSAGGPMHLAAAQTTKPALTSCGTSPAIAGTDLGGTVTMGTGTPTGCVITFNAAYNARPSCTVTPEAPPASWGYTVSQTAITYTQTGTDSDLIDYQCTAQAGG